MAAHQQLNEEGKISPNVMKFSFGTKGSRWLSGLLNKHNRVMTIANFKDHMFSGKLLIRVDRDFKISIRYQGILIAIRDAEQTHPRVRTVENFKDCKFLCFSGQLLVRIDGDMQRHTLNPDAIE